LSVEPFLSAVSEAASRGTFAPSSSTAISSSTAPLPAGLPRLLVFYSLEFEHSIAAISSRYHGNGAAATFGAQLVFANIQKQRPPTLPSTTAPTTVTASTSTESKGPSTTILGYEFGITDYDVNNYSFLYVTSRYDDPSLTTLFINYTHHRVWTYNPTLPSSSSIRLETPSLNRTLGRRFYLVEKARNANIIGIVVGTLGVASYLDLINQLKRSILNAGDQYTANNMAHLANGATLIE
jgi:diphthamide biosynthesis enzyme Dph1/Dph2-like protein